MKILFFALLCAMVLTGDSDAKDAQKFEVAGIPNALKEQNFSPRPTLVDCKSDGEKCSGPSDTSCCAGLSCSYAGSSGGYICF